MKTALLRLSKAESARLLVKIMKYLDKMGIRYMTTKDKGLLIPFPKFTMIKE